LVTRSAMEMVLGNWGRTSKLTALLHFTICSYLLPLKTLMQGTNLSTISNDALSLTKPTEKAKYGMKDFQLRCPVFVILGLLVYLKYFFRTVRR